MAVGKLRFNFAGDSGLKPRRNVIFGQQEDDEEDKKSFMNPTIAKNLSFGETEVEPETPEVEDEYNEDNDFSALRSYMLHTNNVPTRNDDDVKMGFWKKLGTVLAASMGGRNPAESLAIGTDILDTPYQRKLRDWATKEEALGNAAKFEIQGVGNDIRRQDVLNRILGTAGLNNYRNETVRQRDEKQKFEEDKFKTEQDFKREDLKARGWKEIKGDGRIKMYNPIDGETRDLGEDKSLTIAGLNAETNRRNSNINARNAETNRMNASTNSRNVDSLIGSRNRGDTVKELLAGIKFMSYKDREGKTKNIPMREQLMAEESALREVIVENPDYKKYIDEDDEGNFSLKQNMGNDKGFKAFLEAIRARAKKRLSRKYNAVDDDMDMDEEDLSLDELPEG